MIDLHCHLLPGIDDGARDLDMAIAMARMALADGIVTVACTPHILPGVYDNTASQIRDAVSSLASRLQSAQIPLHLTVGADVHLDPNLLAGLRNGQIPTVADSRYFLFEPPHHVAPPRLDAFAFSLVTAGYVPILTHPERLSWIETHFEVIERMADSGVLMQLTAGSLLGMFGRQPKYWAERMLDEGMADLLASDGHDVRRRPPQMAAAREVVAKRCDEATAHRLVVTTPLAILRNVIPSQLRQPQTG